MSCRLAFAVAVALAVAMLPAGVSAGSPPPFSVAVAAQPGPASVQLLECNRGRRPSRRSALFRAEMGQIATGVRMRLRFAVHEKVGNGAWRSVTQLGWRDARAGVKRFAYEQRVAGLKRATKYRTEVDFQWLDAGGHTLAAAQAQSRACRQRGRLPNLAVRAPIGMRPGPTPGTYRYVVKVHNAGRASSPPSALRLAVDGAEVDVRPVGRLRAGERRTVRFVGPVCAGEVTALLDPDDAVREVSERDNSRTTACTAAP